MISISKLDCIVKELAMHSSNDNTQVAALLENVHQRMKLNKQNHLPLRAVQKIMRGLLDDKKIINIANAVLVEGVDSQANTRLFQLSKTTNKPVTKNTMSVNMADIFNR